NAVDIGEPEFQGPTQPGQREAKDALLRSLTMACIMFGSLHRLKVVVTMLLRTERVIWLSSISRLSCRVDVKYRGTNEMGRLAAL
ncbi:hypothetical protein H105_01307, partial [Trichophyton soudanense CBS 452.61]